MQGGVIPGKVVCILSTLIAFLPTLHLVGGIGDDGIDWSDERDPTRVLAACGPDLRSLWTDARIRALLSRNKLRLEEMPGL